MSENDSSAIVLLVFLVIIVLVPIGLIMLTFPAEQYYLVTGEPVREAAQAAGLHVVNSTNVQWPVPGALGGKTYILEDNAGHELVIRTQKFDSEQSRDAIIRISSAQSVGRGKPADFLIVRGQELIFVSPSQEGLLSRIVPELTKSSRA